MRAGKGGGRGVTIIGIDQIVDILVVVLEVDLGGGLVVASVRGRHYVSSLCAVDLLL